VKGSIRERSPGHWAIILDQPDPVTGKRNGIHKRPPVASWDPQNGAAGGTGLWSGYALPPSGPTGQASCRQPAHCLTEFAT
jgi:hypothetical protein